MTNAYTEGTWYVHINDLNCTGNESSIFDCPMNGIPRYSCDHHDDASVICQCECLMWLLIYKLSSCMFTIVLVGNVY